MAKKRSNKTLLGIILVVAFTFYQCLNLYKDIKATKWPSVDGQLHWQTYTTGPYRSEKYNNLLEPMHWKEVEFSYVVDGIRYTSNNISFGFTFSTDFELINPYDTDHSAIKIYFNPRNPKEAELIPGPKAINICFVALGAISTFGLLKRMRKI